MKLSPIGIAVTSLLQLPQSGRSAAISKAAFARHTAMRLPRGGASLARPTYTEPRKIRDQEKLKAMEIRQRRRESPTNARRESSSILPQISLKTSILLVGSITVAFVMFFYRHLWLHLVDKDKIQQATLDLLHSLQPPDATGPSYSSLAIYAAGLSLWELVGLSTIPVETAAGMVFGWHVAVFSLVGKAVGACLAFCIGRYGLSRYVSASLESNSVFQLINQSRAHPALLTALLMKFSLFPELIKNFGSSLLTIIQPWMFLVATSAHGGLFTLLWTWLGVDTASQLESGVASSGGLTGALLVAFAVGVIGTPLLMAWWVRELRKEAETNNQSRWRAPYRLMKG